MLAAPLFTDTRLEEIHRRLLAYYGRPPEREVWDPLKQFIYSLLSSRTKTEISLEVVGRKRKRARPETDSWSSMSRPSRVFVM